MAAKILDCSGLAMWKLTSQDLTQLKGGGGQRFVEFVDRLIRAEAARAGGPQAEIETQLRVNVKDGGVDTQVKIAIAPTPCGWFDEPSCWQFKSVDAHDINDKTYKRKRNDLQSEIHKPFVEELIKHGYAYRFCLLGDLSPQKAAAWERMLTAEARAINPLAPPAQVIHGADLKYWAEQFPAVIAWLRDLTHGVFHWDAWRETCRAVTSHYVPNPAWEPIQRQILQHADFNCPPVGGEPCLTIGGAAGVGKTRLVFETLEESAASPGLVVYAADELEAKAIATAIANAPDQTAILVADECTPSTRFFLNSNLKACSNRLRIICLDNTGERLATAASEIWLSADSLTNTDAILEANYPIVPADRRHQYAQLSRGFVRLAADMCDHDDELKQGDMSGLLSSVERYVRHRLKKPEHLELISLLALFHRVGFRDEVQGELESFCKMASRSAHDFREVVRVVRESPGFVVQAGRYWYSTPAIVSRVLFAEGWIRWAASDLNGFLRTLPPQLHQQFLDRAAKLGEQGVREQLAHFFRTWFSKLTAGDLADANTMDLVSAIVELEPQQFLPRLRAILEAAPGQSLARIGGQANGAKWGPRRALVWLLETLVSFPEFFRDAEACLFRLALHETEPQIGNNASEIWQGLFRVYLSGTAAPFSNRIEVLRTRTGSASVEEASWAFRGLASALQMPHGKVVGPATVAGRLRPRDWEPASTEEELACYQQALILCHEHISRGSSHHRRLAFDVLANSLFFLLSNGFASQLIDMLQPEGLSENETRRLLSEVDHYLEIRTESHSVPAEHIETVRTWIDSFRPMDFDGRLRAVFSRELWDRRFASDARKGRDDSDELAEQILTQPTRLERHLDWLGSREALSAERLGFALGSADAQFACAQMIFRQAERCRSLPLVRGYIRGLVRVDRLPSPQLLSLMDQFERVHPDLAVDLLVFAGDAFDGLNRVLRLVDSGVIPPQYLASFAVGVGQRELSAEEVGRLLPYFVDAARRQDRASVQAGVRFLATYLQFENRHTQECCLEVQEVRNRAWELVDSSLQFLGSRLSHEWVDVVERLSTYDANRAAQLLGRALISEDLETSSQAEERLTRLAPAHPDSVIEAFGMALLDPDNGWRLQVGECRELIAQVPPELVLRWVRREGLHAARAIARHLPRPYVDESNNPVVPALLDALLDEFDDDEVFDNFLAGSHSGVSWRGNGSSHFEREADDARKFLTHPNKRIVQWAAHEVHYCLQMAAWEDHRHAERFLHS